MHRSLSRALIIGALALLTACSALRLGYGQAPELVYWWLDGYVDLDDDQSPRVREALRQWFRWHRGTQLVDYAGLLQHTRGQLADTLTPAQVCRLADEVQARVDTAFEQAVPAVAELARTLTPEQLAHLQHKQAKNNADYRNDYLQDTTEERLKAQVKRVVERAETLYGRLDDAQREKVAQWVADSPFDAQRWAAERELRQVEVRQVLRRIAGGALPPQEAQAAVRRVYQHSFRSPREDYRAYQQRLAQYNCAFAAQVHNLTSPEQRQRAVARLKGWEDDLRSLAAPGRPVAPSTN
ncbi:MAG TPA: DUF6279 family lipoprotein [Albitalea sp.]|uniref:DUF6279 family lipoprotein n=1 Tax=Piscinibacter sp. TaxID=1903157 RepID=UPI002ED073F6